jgi:hypothetical protein
MMRCKWSGFSFVAWLTKRETGTIAFSSMESAPTCTLDLIAGAAEGMNGRVWRRHGRREDSVSMASPNRSSSLRSRPMRAFIVFSIVLSTSFDYGRDPSYKFDNTELTGCGLGPLYAGHQYLSLIQRLH